MGWYLKAILYKVVLDIMDHESIIPEYFKELLFLMLAYMSRQIDWDKGFFRICEEQARKKFSECYKRYFSNIVVY